MIQLHPMGETCPTRDETYATLGQFELAASDFQQALTLDPAHEKAAEMRQKMADWRLDK